MYNSRRESGIELLKVLAVLIIVLCHTSISMTFDSTLSTAEWYYDVNTLPNSASKIVLTLYSYCGYIGNSIFFVCSAWFLLDQKQNRKRKILKMESDVWIISVVYLAVFLLSGVRFRGSTMLRSLLPTTFNNNWFVTAYMLFYFIYPGLNRIIENTSRKNLKYGCLFFAFLICIWTPFFQEWNDFKFYFSYPLMWVLVYFCISYLKTYHIDRISSRSFSVLLLSVGIFGLIAEICLTYYFGEYAFFISGDGMRWNMWFNPFHWFIAFGSFNLFRSFRFHNVFINRISSLSLLIYLIHENFLVREHWRPFIYEFIYHELHNEHVAFWLAVFALLTFIVSAAVAFLYQISIQKVAYRVSDKVCDAINRKGSRAESQP